MLENTKPTALQGIKVLDLTRLVPGPYCTLLLGDLGAEIIKVEEKGRGDYLRDVVKGAYYAINRNKKSITLDLKKEEARQVIYDLAKQCDVVLEGFRPGVTTRLGVDYETLSNINPQLIYCSISGYGQDGPFRLEPGHDVNYMAMSGALSVPGQYGYPPMRSGLPVADLSSAMFATVSILSAIIARSHTNKGQYIDVSMVDSVFSWASTRFGDYMLDQVVVPNEEMDHVIAANDVFSTKDGKQVAIGAVEEPFWRGLLTSIDRQEWLDDARFNSHHARQEHKKELHGALTQIFLTKDQATWIDILLSNKVPATKVNNAEEAFLDPHLNARGMIQKIFTPDVGKDVLQIAYPAKMSETPAVISTPAPTYGQHTDEILMSVLGYSEDTIRQLKSLDIF